MGRVREWNFDAVIGLGGKRPWPGHKDIAKRVNWIGINPSKTKAPNGNWKGPLVRFERFVLYDEKGPELKRLAPNLFKYMYEDRHVRAVLSQSLAVKIQAEVTRILELAKKHKRTRRLVSDTALTKSKCCGRKGDKSDSLAYSDTL
jgi:hypothetical protein